MKKLFSIVTILGLSLLFSCAAVVTGRNPVDGAVQAQKKENLNTVQYVTKQSVTGRNPFDASVQAEEENRQTVERVAAATHPQDAYSAILQTDDPVKIEAIVMMHRVEYGDGGTTGTQSLGSKTGMQNGIIINYRDSSQTFIVRRSGKLVNQLVIMARSFSSLQLLPGYYDISYSGGTYRLFVNNEHNDGIVTLPDDSTVCVDWSFYIK